MYDRILKNKLQEGSHLKKKQGLNNMGDTALEPGDHVCCDLLAHKALLLFFLQSFCQPSNYFRNKARVENEVTQILS